MKIRNWLPGWFAVLILFLYGCSKPVPNASDAASDPSRLGIQETDIGVENTSVPTSAHAVTNASGQTVTDTKGQVVTVVGTEPESSVSNTVNAVGSSSGNGSGSPAQNRTTPNRTTMETASAQWGSTTTSTGTHTVKPTTAPTTQMNSSPHKPTTTTTSENSTGPWDAPYDLPAIYTDCKHEIERIGMTWEEGLRPDSLGVSWANPDNTVVYTYYPEMFNLRDYVIDELIPEYRNKPYSRQSCRVWLEPYEESPGNYLVYFLERR